MQPLGLPDDPEQELLAELQLDQTRDQLQATARLGAGLFILADVVMVLILLIRRHRIEPAPNAGPALVAGTAL